MKGIDICILLPLIWGAYKGYRKGLITELGTLFVFILATIFSFKLLEKVIGYLKPYISNESIIPVVAFLITFIGILIGGTLLIKAVKKFLDFSLLGSLDDLAGGILGVLKWTYILSIILWLINEGGISLPSNFTQDAVLYPYLLTFGPVLIDFTSAIFPLTKDIVQSITNLI